MGLMVIWQHSEGTSAFKKWPNIPGTRMVLSVPFCMRIYIEGNYPLTTYLWNRIFTPFTRAT